MPTCSGNRVCSGHQRDDPLPISFDHASGQSSVSSVLSLTSFTMQSFMDYVHPENDDLTYRYDQFSWDHWEALGFALED